MSSRCIVQRSGVYIIYGAAPDEPRARLALRSYCAAADYVPRAGRCSWLLRRLPKVLPARHGPEFSHTATPSCRDGGEQEDIWLGPDQQQAQQPGARGSVGGKSVPTQQTMGMGSVGRVCPHTADNEDGARRAPQGPCPGHGASPLPDGGSALSPAGRGLCSRETPGQLCREQGYGLGGAQACGLVPWP